MSSPLRRARDGRRWSQAGAARRLVALAQQRDGKVKPSLASAKQMISDWEGGRRPVGREYQKLLCELYESTPSALGFPERMTKPGKESLASSEANLIGQISASRAIDSTTTEMLQAQVDGIRLLDRRLGAPAVIDQTRGIVKSLEQMMTHTLLPSARQPLATVLADAATLAAWQCLDAGLTTEAWKHYASARVAGQESENVALLAHTMGEQANVLLDLNLPIDAVQLLQSAQALGKWKIPDLLRAWLFAAEAEAYAAANDPVGCRRALDQASSTMPAVVINDDMLYLSLDDAHLARWRGHSLARIGDPSATNELFGALNAMAPEFVRARAGLESNLARALFAQGERREAIKHATAAQALAKQTGSVRQLRQVGELRKLVA